MGDAQFVDCIEEFGNTSSASIPLALGASVARHAVPLTGRSTMVAYATILHDVLPNAAAHVLTASIVSAPAGVLLARIIVPRDAAIESAATYDPAASKRYDSSIDALIKGTTDGLHIRILTDKLLFDSGSATPLQGSYPLLAKLGTVLAREIQQRMR